MADAVYEALSRRGGGELLLLHLDTGDPVAKVTIPLDWGPLADQILAKVPRLVEAAVEAATIPAGAAEVVISDPETLAVRLYGWAGDRCVAQMVFVDSGRPHAMDPVDAPRDVCRDLAIRKEYVAAPVVV